jgi:hypothetical protein
MDGMESNPVVDQHNKADNHENFLRQYLITAALAGALAFTTTIAQAADPQLSWNNGEAKKSRLAPPLNRELTKDSSFILLTPEGAKWDSWDRHGSRWSSIISVLQSFVLHRR